MTDQTQTTENESEEQTTETDSGTEWVPPSKDQWEELLRKKNRADSEAASRKRWLRDLGYDPLTGQKVSDSAENDDNTEAEAQGQKASEKPAPVDTATLEKNVATKTEAVFVALAEAGVGPKSLSRVSKMIDKSAITIGEDGIEGLSSQIDSLKEELPELFKRSRGTAVADASTAGAGQKQAPAADQNKDYATKLAEAIFNGR